mgnify:CR=1 FL=1
MTPPSLSCITFFLPLSLSLSFSLSLSLLYIPLLLIHHPLPRYRPLHASFALQ